jgi:hypothetical protein
LASNDDKAKAIARDIVNKYNISLRNITSSVAKGRTSAKEARQYAADARADAAQKLDGLSRGPGISSDMRKKIKRVADRAKNHDPSGGHGSWWANGDSKPNDNPSSWI